MHPAVGDHLHALGFGGGQLNPVGALLGLVRASHVAHARALAALDVDREPLDRITERPATVGEQLVVLVDILVGQLVDVVLLLVAPHARRKIVERQAGNGPALQRALGNFDRGAGIGERRAAIAAGAGDVQRLIAIADRAGIEEQLFRHFQFAAGELVVIEVRPPFEHGDARPLRAERRQGAGDGAAAGARADDQDIELRVHGSADRRKLPTMQAQIALLLRRQIENPPQHAVLGVVAEENQGL